MKRYAKGSWEEGSVHPPDELSLQLAVNGRELVCIQCTPEKPEQLGIGFLFTSGIIHRLSDIQSINYDRVGKTLYIKLVQSEFPVPQRLVLTSGFGGGPVFSNEVSVCDLRVSDHFQLLPEQIIALMAALKDAAVRYKQSGGIHATALCSCDRIIHMAEDVGRQNSMDKTIGEGLITGTPFVGKAMLTTGRVSFEMVQKTVRAGIPVLASLSSPTAKAVELARQCGIAIAGYVTGSEFIAYSNEWRFGA